MTAEPFILHARAGWGSAIVEAQLAWYGLPYRLQESGDLLGSAEARDRLAPLNPLAQVPVLQWPNGSLMTESAAITLHLADGRAAQADAYSLVPEAQARERAAFLRWLVYLVANVYPTFTYADLPGRFVTSGEEAAAAFRREVDAYQRKLWAVVEGAVRGPWFLGERFSALDIYLAVMARWRPGRAWFAQHAPRVVAAADRTAALPALASVFQRNFPP